MSKKTPDHQEYPLLIKIEACPKTARTEPCSDECTKECIKKSYTIFDPKPPRKKRSSVVEPPVPPPQPFEVVQEPKTSPMSTSPESSPGITPVISQISRSRSQLSTQKTPPPEEKEEKDLGCTLEILVLEKHDRDCKNKKSTVDTLDWVKGYNIISHHAVRICQGNAPTQLYAPQTSESCDCGKEMKKSSCPVCSRPPCHGRKVNTPFTSVKDVEPLPPSEPLPSFSNISEPDSYIESVDSGGGGKDYIPDFKQMPIVRQHKKKKYPFLYRYFTRNRKKSEHKAGKAQKME